MNVCLFGGTFDPPHIGHFNIAESILDEFSIDKFLFIPSFIPPDKINKPYSAAEHRLAMLKLTIADNPRFQISEVELNRKGVSYTVDTIQEIQAEMHIGKAQTYLLIGGDSLVEFHTWREPDTILSLAKVIVAIRPGFDVRTIDKSILNRIQLAKSPLWDISSSAIRERIAAGLPVSSLIVPEVLTYIREHKLYLS